MSRSSEQALENDMAEERLRDAAAEMLQLLTRCEWFLRDLPALPPVGAELLEDICALKAKAEGESSP